VTNESTSPSRKPRDLEARTFKFAQDVVTSVETCPRTVVTSEQIRQVVRSSGSVGANYIEAHEALSRKDFALRIKICRKEVKETNYWLRLMKTNGPESERRRLDAIRESEELLKIFSAAVQKLK